MPVNEDYTLVVTNPTEYDGDPYEVAERAVGQSLGVARSYLATLESARLMARNAELERQLVRDGSCDAVAWEDGAEGKRYAKLIEQTAAHVRTLALLERVAGFNPKAKIGAR
jgi:hypothetical protein